MLLAFCSLLSSHAREGLGARCSSYSLRSPNRRIGHPSPLGLGLGERRGCFFTRSSEFPKPEARGTLHRRFGERSEYEPGECAPSLRRQASEKSARTHNSRSSGMGSPMRRFGERSEYEPQRAAHTARSCERNRTINKEFKPQKAQQNHRQLG